MQIMVAPKRIGFRLRQILEERERRGEPLNQSQLAAAAGVHFATVHRLYHDATDRVDLAVVEKLCDVLGVTPNDLLGWTPKRGKR